MKEDRTMNGAQLACAVAGGQTALSTRLTARGKPITPQGVQWWCSKIRAVPASHGWAVAVSEITGLPLYKLNPEAYPREKEN